MSKIIKNRFPLVSVILPAYNAEKYVYDAVRSILRQTYPNIELIIVDDGSTDKTASIIDRLSKSDNRIIVIHNKKRLYMAGALNIALKKAKGRYIARMDADDISLPTRIEKQVLLLKQYSSLVAVGGQVDIIDGSGKVIAEKYFPTDPVVCYQMIMNFMPIQPPTLMTRASVMKKLRYDIGIAKNDDIDMQFQLLQYGGFSNTSDVVFQYRVQPNSYTFRDMKSVFHMALSIRIRAIMRYHYRPSVLQLLLLAFITFGVCIIPSQLIVLLFEYMRYQHSAGVRFLSRIRFAFSTA